MALERKIGYVNLTSGKVETAVIPLSLRESYLGGRGLNAYLLYNRMASNPSSLAPESVVVFGAGLLCGAPAAGAAALHIAFRSPLSERLGSAIVTGHFAAELRFAGFDHLVFFGKAPALSVVAVRDGAIEILSFPGLEGAGTMETVRLCRERLEDEEARVIAVGPAGENGVRLADVRPGFGAVFSGAGLGAVLGAKNLKAVVARGTRGLDVFSPTGSLKYNRDLTRRILQSRTGMRLARSGTTAFFEAANAAGRIRVRDFGSNVFPDAEPLAAGSLETRFPGVSSSCFSCPVACRKLRRVDEENGLFHEGPDLGALCAFGPLLGCRSLEAVLESDRLCRQQGLPPIETGAVLAWAADALHRGVLDASEIEAPLPRFEDPGLLGAWVRRIGAREGFGKVLGEGLGGASEDLPSSAYDFALRVKGLSLPPVDLRAAPALALAAAVGASGPACLSGAPWIDLADLPPGTRKTLFSGPDLFDGPFGTSAAAWEGKARMVFWQELCDMIADSLGLCRLCTAAVDPDLLQFPAFSKMVYFATGLKLDPEETFRIGQRAVCLERMFNLRAGLTRRDDALPDRLFEEPVPQGPPSVKGKRLDREAMNELVEAYYDLNGFTAHGIPTDRRKMSLGLDKEPTHRL